MYQSRPCLILGALNTVNDRTSGEAAQSETHSMSEMLNMMKKTVNHCGSRRKVMTSKSV